MAMQRRISASSTSPLAIGSAPNALNCDCDVKMLPHRDVACCDAFAAVALSLVRFIAAAYATGDADCWEAAYRVADDSASTSDGALLVARAAGLVRVIRRCRDRDLTYLPSSCNRLSIEEARLMALIEAARSGDTVELAIAASGLVEIGHEGETIRAANALADLSRRPAMRRPPRYAEHGRTTTTPKQGRRNRRLNQAS